MSYQAVSIKEAMNKINATTNNGWFLPQIQRPYVWGGRHESESYVCSLFDSILKGYPIGGLVVWETEARVPHREFLTNYDPLSKQRMVQEGRWECAKGLIYDGQQRLQTLFSALRYTFNGRVLIFDLCFDPKKEGQEPSETGFEFIDQSSNQSSKLPRGAVHLSQLFCQPEKGESKIALRKEIISKGEFTEDEKNRIEINLDKLWSIFVETNNKPISYFPVQSTTDLEVNEIFQRLNSGGMPLTQIDLLFSRITQISPGFKDKLSDASDDIKAIAGITGSGNGFEFSPEDILQVIHLALVGSPTVRSERVQEPKLVDFVNYWSELKEPLTAFFNEYLWGCFKINSNSIIPRKLALLPIIIYLTELYKSKQKFRAIKDDNLLLVHQYFILSQLKDWNTATMIAAFAEKVKAAKNGSFPIAEIKLIAEQKHRRTDLQMRDVLCERWFVLKILTQKRVYNFSGNKPEVDHIFPRGLPNPPDGYTEDKVDILWNLQPVSFAANNSKRAKHPLYFFNSEEGKKYFSEYDYLPEINSDLWEKPFDFIEDRKTKMVEALDTQYKLTIVEIEPVN